MSPPGNRRVGYATRNPPIDGPARRATDATVAAAGGSSPDRRPGLWWVARGATPTLHLSVRGGTDKGWKQIGRRSLNRRVGYASATHRSTAPVDGRWAQPSRRPADRHRIVGRDHVGCAGRNPPYISASGAGPQGLETNRAALPQSRVGYATRNPPIDGTGTTGDGRNRRGGGRIVTGSSDGSTVGCAGRNPPYISASGAGPTGAGNKSGGAPSIVGCVTQRVTHRSTAPARRAMGATVAAASGSSPDRRTGPWWVARGATHPTSQRQGQDRQGLETNRAALPQS